MNIDDPGRSTQNKQSSKNRTTSITSGTRLPTKKQTTGGTLSGAGKQGASDAHKTTGTQTVVPETGPKTLDLFDGEKTFPV